MRVRGRIPAKQTTALEIMGCREHLGDADICGAMHNPHDYVLRVCNTCVECDRLQLQLSTWKLSRYHIHAQTTRVGTVMCRAPTPRVNELGVTHTRVSAGHTCTTYGAHADRRQTGIPAMH